MMTPSSAAAACFSLFAVFGTLVFLLTLYADYRADLLRHRLAAVRDELLDLAAASRAAAADAAYRKLLSTLDGAIEHAGRITLCRFLLVQAFWRRATRSGSLTERLCDQPQAWLPVCQRMQLLVARHMLLGSPLGWSWLLALALQGVLRGRPLKFWSDASLLLPGVESLPVVVETAR